MGASSSTRYYARHPPPSRKRVVVVGGNTAGTTAAKLLAADFDVILIDRKEYCEIVPGNVECALHPERFDRYYGMAHAEMHEGEAGRFAEVTIGSARLSLPSESSGGTVVVDGDETNAIGFDFLVLACGRPYSLFKADGCEGHSQHDWRTVAGRRRSLDEWRGRIEAASHVVCAGGGAVGVELAAEILECMPSKKVTIVASGDALLPEEDPAVQRYALDHLHKYDGFAAVFNDRVDDEGRLTKADSMLKGHVNVNVSGTNYTTTEGGGNCLVIRCHPSPHAGNDLGLPPESVDDRGRIKVDTHFQIVGIEAGRGTCFAVGDATDGGGRGAVRGEYASIAKAEASVCVDNIYRACHGEALCAMPPQKVANVVTLGSKLVTGSIVAPDGKVVALFTGGIKSRIVAMVKGRIHRTSASMLKEASKKTYFARVT